MEYLFKLINLKYHMVKKKSNKEFEDYLETQLDEDSIDSAEEGFMLGYYDYEDEE